MDGVDIERHHITCPTSHRHGVFCWEFVWIDIRPTLGCLTWTSRMTGGEDFDWAHIVGDVRQIDDCGQCIVVVVRKERIILVRRELAPVRVTFGTRFDETFVVMKYHWPAQQYSQTRQNSRIFAEAVEII